MARSTCTYKRYFALKSSVFSTIKNHKRIVLFSILCCIFSVVVVAFILSNHSESIEIYNCIDKKFICFLCGEIGFWGYFFSKLFWLLICFSIIIFSCFSRLFYLLSFSCIVCYCFCAIFDLAVVIMCFSLSGIFFCILTLIPMFLIQFILLLFLLCDCYEAYYCNCKNAYFFSNNGGKIIVLILISLCVNVLFLILMKIFSPIFIIIV